MQNLYLIVVKNVLNLMNFISTNKIVLVELQHLELDHLFGK